MFGWKLIKEKELNKLKKNENDYFYKWQEVEDKKFELEEENFQLNNYVTDLYHKIYNRYGFSSIGPLYRLNVYTEECKEYKYKTLVINLVPINCAVNIDNVPELSSIIDKNMIYSFSERMSEEFKNYIVSEMLRNFGYGY